MTDPQHPAAQGFRMPAEWEPHAGTWLAWPHNLGTWSSEILPDVEQTYLAMVRALAPGEMVHILVNDPASLESVEKKIRDAGITLDRVRHHIIPTDDAWIRDYGPNFLVRNDLAEGLSPNHKRVHVVSKLVLREGVHGVSKLALREGVHGVSKLTLSEGVAFNNWEFDSWGGKYDWKLDNEAAGKIAKRLEMPTFEPGIVLEGGAIDVNGKGTCLTTEPCLLNANRNGGLSREIMEGYLLNYLGVEKVIWLKGGIEGDDTDGHIDNLARFVNPTTILCAYEDDASDPNYGELKENYETLLSSTDQDGSLLNIIRLPMPGVIETSSIRLPASYANFYIGNRTVLLPVYNVPNDRKAQSLLQEAFPDRVIIPILCRDLVQGLGAIHCLTQQQPNRPI